MSRTCYIILLVIASILLLLGIGAFIGTPYLFTQLVISFTHVTADSVVYSSWQTPMVPPTMTFYVFDLRNPKEVVQIGAKPFLVQRGPYTYSEIRPKLNVTFNDNHTVTYDQPKTFFYMNATGDDEDVQVTTLNMPILVLANLFSDLPTWTAFLADGVLEVLDGGSLFVRKKASQVIWGWSDPLLSFVVQKAQQYFNVTLTELDLVGFYISHNGTSEGVWNVWDGSSDYRLTSQIYSWNGNTSIDCWSSTFANMLNGTDGFSYWPNMQQSDTVYLFHFDLARSTRFDFSEVIQNRGVRAYRYAMPDSMVADPAEFPDNQGFCPPGGPCLKAGVWNVSRCHQRLPIILSLPQLFLADPLYLDAVDGMHPDRQLHGSYIEIEPISGYTVGGHIRAQINVAVGPIPGLPDTANVNPLFYPAIWVDHSGEMDDSAALFITHLVYLPQTLLTIVLPALLLAFGLLMACLVGLRCARQSQQVLALQPAKSEKTNSPSSADDRNAMLNSRDYEPSEV